MVKSKFAFSIFLFLWGISLPALAAKPRPPIQLALLQIDLSENQSKLTLMATANVESDQVELSLVLPLGLSLVEGLPEWQGALKEGETKKIDVVIENLGRISREVVGKAVIHLGEGGTFTQQSRLTLNQPRSESSFRPPPLKQGRRDGAILEFKGK